MCWDPCAQPELKGVLYTFPGLTLYAVHVVTLYISVFNQ
jgi:hypothetical protein